MRGICLAASIAAQMCLCLAAHAYTYDLTHQWGPGQLSLYANQSSIDNPSNYVAFNVDWGQEFSSVTSVTIDWTGTVSGRVTYGLIDGQGGSIPWSAPIVEVPVMVNSDSGSWWATLGSAADNGRVYSSFDDFKDGSSSLRLRLGSVSPPLPDMTQFPGYSSYLVDWWVEVDVETLALVVEGTPVGVPEPSSVTAVALGFALLLSSIRRRRS